LQLDQTILFGLVMRRSTVRFRQAARKEALASMSAGQGLFRFRIAPGPPEHARAIRFGVARNAGAGVRRAPRPPMRPGAVVVADRSGGCRPLGRPRVVRGRLSCPARTRAGRCSCFRVISLRPCPSWAVLSVSASLSMRVATVARKVRGVIPSRPAAARAQVPSAWRCESPERVPDGAGTTAPRPDAAHAAVQRRLNGSCVPWPDASCRRRPG
jgi:hypothetical protein